MNSVSRSVINGLRWITLSRLVSQILTWINTFFVIRLLSPTEFGLAALASIFASYLAMMNELGFSVTLVRWQTRDRETLKYVFGALLLVGTLFTLATIVAAPLLGILTKEPQITPLIRLISIQFLTMAFGVIPQSQLSMDMKFRQLGIADVVAALIGGATTLIVALRGGGAWSLIVGTVVLTISRTLMLNLFSRSIAMPRLNFAKLRHLAGFSGLVMLEKTLWYWYMQVDSFIVGRFLGATQLGIYAVGRQVTNIPLERAMSIINSVALPAFALVQSEPERIRAGYLKVLRLGAAYAFPVFWGLAVVSEALVRVVVGSKWIASAFVIQLLCISMPLRMLNSFTSSAATAVGRQDVNIKSLVFAFVLIPSSVVVGVHWGIRGVAAAWAIAFPFAYALNAWLIRRALRIDLSEMFVAVSPPAGAALLMACAMVCLDKFWLDSLAPSAQLAIAVPFGAVIFIAILCLLSRATASEMLQFIRHFMSRAA